MIVVTEGRADAQEWTVQELGPWPYIDVPATTNEIGISKVDGFLGAVLKKHGIHSGEMVYLGDNEVRDVRPAQKEGVSAIQYDQTEENLSFQKSRYSEYLSWDILQTIFQDE